MTRIASRGGCVSVLALLAGLALPCPTSASLSVSMISSAGDSCETLHDSNGFTLTTDTEPTISQAVAAAVAGSCASGSTSAVVNLGYGYFNASATATGMVFIGGMGSSVSLGFTDMVIIDAPGLTGTIGSFTPMLSILISIDANPGFTAQFSYGVTVGSVSVFSSGGINDNGTFYGDDPANPPMPGAVSFIYGQPFEINISGDLSASGGADGLQYFGAASALFPGSIHWQGMSGLPDGAVVTQGQIDWMEEAPVVPGPGALSAALVGILGMRRSRR